MILFDLEMLRLTKETSSLCLWLLPRLPTYTPKGGFSPPPGTMGADKNAEGSDVIPLTTICSRFGFSFSLEEVI